MVFTRSILAPATYVKQACSRCPSSKFHLSACSRKASQELASTSGTKTPSTRSRKKLHELPSAYTLPDGTVAAPLGDWRDSSKHVKPSSLRIPQQTTVGIDINNLNIEKDTSLTTPSNEPESEVGKTRRMRKKAANLTSSEDDSVPKHSRAKKSAPTLEPSEDEDLSTLPRTILAREIQDNLKKFPHCLLLTRVGQFYESYFDQAEEIAQLLNIKFTSRKWGGQRVAMCGFPVVQLDKHLKVLVQQHKRFVAMCEEFPRTRDFNAKEFERRVTRIITPGTLIDEPFLNAYENNFLLAIGHLPDTESVKKEALVGLAWIDISTGEFFSKRITLESVQDELARINPREVVLDKIFQGVKNHPLMDALAEENCFLSFIGRSVMDNTVVHEQIGDEVHNAASNNNDIIPLSLTNEEQLAVDLLTSYLNANLLESMPPLTSPVQDDIGRMQIDAHTIKALEIREASYEGGTRGSLLSVIKRTVTSGGTRLLARWLCSPSTSLPEITFRQTLVEFFLQRPHLAADLVQLLCNISDTSRLTQKFLAGRGDVNDLLAINKTIQTWTIIREMIAAEKRLEAKEQEKFRPEEWNSIDVLMSRMHILTNLSEKINDALGLDIADESQTELVDYPEKETEEFTEATQLVNWKLTNNRWFIRPEFSEKLKILHDQLQKLLDKKDDMERDLRIRYGAPSLTLRASPGQGMHVHLARKRGQVKQLDNETSLIAISESGSTKCYFYKDWSLLGNQIAQMIFELAQAEKEAFDILRAMINELAYSLRRNSEIIDELDVALSFAKVADELKFVKPTTTNDNVYNATNGRHPSVEMGLLTSGRVFTPNSVQLTPEAKIHIITGPNMAGKSTFLRQIALTSILAQIGSFVPAEAATIGIIDKLFSRIGAKDDLFRDRSTFMVEMLETADILHRATERSLVIMDEVGRGTTVNDGLAIAFATVHHLATVTQCRTLFATHFHELANMLGQTDEETGSGMYKNVRFYCTDIDETDDGYFTYSYRMRPGVNWDSHGLKVAQLAGLPDSVIDVASSALDWLKRHRGSEQVDALSLKLFNRAIRDINTSNPPKANFYSQPLS